MIKHSLTVAVGLVLAGLAGCNDTSEKGSARRAISLCWEDQKKASLPPAQARFIAGACERMEADFRQKYNASP